MRYSSLKRSGRRPARRAQATDSLALAARAVAAADHERDAGDRGVGDAPSSTASSPASFVRP